MTHPPWSFSSLKKYETCPRQYYETRVLRSVIEEPGEAATLGSQVHELFETAIAGKQEFPSNLKRYGRYAETVRNWAGETRTEAKLAITRDLTPTGFDAPDCWGRGSIDVLNINGNRARVVDWKTGKKRSEDAYSQACVYASLVFINYPQIDELRALWVYLNESSIETYEFIRTQMPSLLRFAEETFKQIEHSHATGVWLERPSGLCNGWCPVTQCPHWRPKRRLTSKTKED